MVVCTRRETAPKRRPGLLLYMNRGEKIIPSRSRTYRLVFRRKCAVTGTACPYVWAGITGFLSFADFVAGNSPLPIALETVHLLARFEGVLGASALHPRPPTPPRSGLQRTAHQHDHLRFRQAELRLDGVEGRPVFPGHFDDPVRVTGR
jgi:hypothetical protein